MIPSRRGPSGPCRVAHALAPALVLVAAVGCGGEKSATTRVLSTPAGPGGTLDAPVAGFDALQQEQYGHAADNPFQTVAEHPRSTFSADVNTATYSNVRRFLNGGHLPPPDAVELAGLVNYFPYDYPNPAGADPVSVTLDLAACPWQPAHRLVRIGVKARSVPAAEQPPRNLVFLVDTSGSMQGPTRLPLVKRSLHLLIDQLTDRDAVSIVTYAGTTGVRLPPTRGGQKARIREVVDGLDAGGGTNGAAGLQLAYDQARAAFLDGGANRVILCTDGDFNVGVTGEGDLVRLIERERQGHVFLTVLGYGMGNLKSGQLEQIANHGNGHYAYIDSEAEAHKVFVEQGAALVAVAKDVKFQVEFNPARVAAYRLLGYENRLLRPEDFKDDAKDAGDLGGGHTVTALYQVVPAGGSVAGGPAVEPLKYQTPAKATPAAAGSGEWLTVRVRYKHPESAASLELVRPLAADAAGPAGADFRFAAAVAEFGMLLRASPDRGAANYDRALAAAEAARGADPGGHRAEFTALVRKARRLAKAVAEDAPPAAE